MEAQFVGCGINHESFILIDYWSERFYAADSQTSQIRKYEFLIAFHIIDFKKM